ncbi:MAG: Tm-1-like ATP-binding domain-containing protein [bacterium]
MAVAIVGMLDERQEALSFLCQRIRSKGMEALLIDTSLGIGGISPREAPDVSSGELARLGGIQSGSIRELAVSNREKATSLMSQGLTEKILEFQLSHRIRGVVAVGGMTTSTIALPALRALPFGFPKLLVSSAAAMPAYAGKFSQFLGLRDITVMHTVVDTVGMNPLVRTLMNNACGAICGMVENWLPVAGEKRPSVALTELGFCDKGAQQVRQMMEELGYNVISFHATGMGDRAAEDLVGQGLFQAFVDLVPAGLSEHLLGGNRDAGPSRLLGAVRSKTPYILTPCGFDMLSCGPIERKEKGDPLWIDRGLAQRKLLVQDHMRVQARTTAQEVEMVAKEVAHRLNQHPRKELVFFVVPVRGFSSLSVEGGPLHDPEVDSHFLQVLKGSLDPAITVREVDAHINEPAFARAVVEALVEALGRVQD